MFITISYMHFNHGYRRYCELYIYLYIHTRKGPSHLEDSRSDGQLFYSYNKINDRKSMTFR